MKRYISTLVAIVLATSVFSQEGGEFTIEGKFATSYYDGLTIYLNKIDYKETNAVTKIDSTVVAGDSFVLKGKGNNSISLGYITVDGNEDLSAIVVLEKGTIGLVMGEAPQMTGTVKNDELRGFSNKQLETNKELQNILERAQSLHKSGLLDQSTSDELEQVFKNQQELMRKEVYAFVSKNILNELGEFFFTIYAPNMKTMQMEELYASGNQEFQQGFIIKSLMNQHVWSLGKLREGQVLEGIEMKNQDGKIEDIAMHFGKGKVVLVDFWASWCRPCLMSMPAIVKMYDRYKESGFDIVGISLDDSELSWKKMIERMGMEWVQYIDDGSGWRGAAAQRYNITSIPQTFLLDREGKIVGHNLQGGELLSKIEELLEKK